MPKEKLLLVVFARWAVAWLAGQARAAGAGQVQVKYGGYSTVVSGSRAHAVWQ